MSLINPFENYAPPAVEDILSDDPRFTVSILALKQRRIAVETCQALLRDNLIEDVLAGKEGYTYDRPVADLQRYGKFESPQKLMMFVSGSAMLGMSAAMALWKIQEVDGTTDVQQKYNNGAEPYSGTVHIRIDK